MNKTKKTNINFTPGDIFHPGEYIKDELDARSMSQQVLASKMKVHKSEISLIINGHRNLHPKMAVLLERALGIDAEFWMNLQIKYDIELVKKQMTKTIKNAKIEVTKKVMMNRLVTSS